MTFNHLRKTLIIGIVLVFSMLVFVMPVFAEEGTLDSSDTIFGSAYMDVCSFTVSVTGNYSIPTVTAAAYIWIQVHAGPDGSTPYEGVYGNTDGTASTDTLTAGIIYYAIIRTDLENAPLTYSFTISGDGSVSTSCASAASASVASVASVVDDTLYPPDSRLNWQFGDLGAVLYSGVDSDGNPAINVYCYNGDNAWLGMQVNDASVSGISADGCDATFYILPEGGYQFNINYDGKLYEIECEDLVCENPVMRYFDPNE